MDTQYQLRQLLWRELYEHPRIEEARRIEEALRTWDWRGALGMARIIKEAQREEEAWRIEEALRTGDWTGALGMARIIKEARRRALEEEELGKVSLVEKRSKALLEEKWKLLLSAVALLYQCLIGYIDRGGTKSYSSGSLEFRPTYVSIVLFQGAYVWIQFRDVAPSGYRRIIKSKSSGATRLATKLEVRYKPPRRSGVTNYIYLCMCDTEEEARIYKKIAGRYYEERNDGKLDLGNDDFFVIPPMPIEQEQALSVSEKIALVKDKVKEVYQDFLKAKDARSQPDIATNTDGAGDHDLAVPLIESSRADDSEGHFRYGPVQPSSMLATEFPPALLYQGPDLVSAPQGIRAFHNVGMDKELLVRGESSQPVELALRSSTAERCAPLSGGPPVAVDHGFWAEMLEMMNLSPVHGDNADPFENFEDGCHYPSEGEFEMFDVLPQQQSAATPMVEDLNPPDTESVDRPSDLRLEGMLNVVQEASVVGATVDEVDDSEGALHNSQASESPFESPVLTIQGGSDTMALDPDKIAPSVTDFGPPVSTPDLLVSLAQRIQERDGKITKVKQQLEELKQQLEELEQQQSEEQKQLLSSGNETESSVSCCNRTRN